MITLVLALLCPDLSGEYLTSAGRMHVRQEGCESISMSVGSTRVDWSLLERGWQGNCDVQCARVSSDMRAIHARFMKEARLGDCIYQDQSFALNDEGNLVISYDVACIDGRMNTLQDVFRRAE